MRLSGAGAPGTIDATVRVFFGEAEPGVTRIDYEADAVVGGMVGGVGQRMLTSVSRRMAKEFFDNVGAAIAAPAGQVGEAGGVGDAGTAEPGAASREAMPKVYTEPRPGRVAAQDDFLKGIAVGAGLVLLGVVAGAVLGRRR